MPWLLNIISKNKVREIIFEIELLYATNYEKFCKMINLYVYQVIYS